MKCEMIVPTLNGVIKEWWLLNHVLDPIIREFGWCRHYRTQGARLSNDGFAGKMVNDIETTVECYVRPLYNRGQSPLEVRTWWRELGRRVCERWEQECVFIAFDNEHELIYWSEDNANSTG